MAPGVLVGGTETQRALSSRERVRERVWKPSEDASPPSWRDCSGFVFVVGVILKQVLFASSRGVSILVQSVGRVIILIVLL